MQEDTVTSGQNIKSKPLQYIIQQLEPLSTANPSEIRQIVLKAEVSPEDLKPWADFDHPVEDSYGRNLIYKGERFEVMAMSWRPGDFSAIHDHGFTQWGAVQIFGPAEHAVFRVEEDGITTLSRKTVKPNDVLGVSHGLIHQMGNPTPDTFFLSLHVYGTEDPVDSITGDARIFDVENGKTQRVDGGVFFALPSDRINRTEKSLTGDFPTTLRYMIELVRRVRKMEAAGISGEIALEQIIQKLFSTHQNQTLLNHLEGLLDANGHVENSLQWRVLNQELKELAHLQHQELGDLQPEDKFFKYSELYDALISKPCLDDFISNYINFFIEKFQNKLTDKKIISLGCGTGLVEEYMMDSHQVPYHNIYGIDISEAMVNVAKKRMQAEIGDITTLDPSIQMWDMAISSLNVFLYLPSEKLEEAISKTAAVIHPGGYFIGDFITPDHIRWYPNIMFSEDKRVISLRTPRLVEKDGRMFQESEIINISFLGKKMEVSYAGKHLRYLPPLHRVRSYFEKAFDGTVELYDTHTLKLIPDWADSCTSTRYVVIARKEKV